MESTGDYWKPVYFLLEQQDLDCVLYHAAQVKALPGRPKTDPLTDHLGVFSQLAGRVVMGVATVAGHERRRGGAAGSASAGGSARRDA
jgi:hypothetical protein